LNDDKVLKKINEFIWYIRYGHEAGTFCEDATSTIGNSVLTGYNVKGLAPKAVAKRVAKNAGKAVITSRKDGDPPTSP